MKLRLKIVSYKGGAPLAAGEVELGEAGGIIGRSRDNDLVLDDPDRSISGKHARISVSGGMVQITDTSLNGTYINGPERALNRDQSSTLQSGDQIFIGEYIIDVTIDAEQDIAAFEPTASPFADAPAANPFTDPAEHSPQEEISSLDPLAESHPASFERNSFNRPSEQTGTPELSIDDILGNSNASVSAMTESVPEQAQQAAQADNIPGINEFMTPPSAQPEVAPMQSTSGFFSEPASADTPPLGSNGDQLIPDGWGNESWLDEAPEALETLNPEPAPQYQEAMPQDSISEQKDISSFEAVVDAPSVQSGQEGLVPAAPSSPTPITEGSVPKPQNQATPHQHDQSPATEPATASPMSNKQAMQAFLDGAKASSLQISPEIEAEFFHIMGKLFRHSVEGLVDVLRARTDIKSAFKMSMTTIRPTENNPLKFSLNTDDAMQKLLNNPGNACLPAEQAFTEAFDDVKAHELAVMAGMQAALDDVLQRFKPDELAAYFDQRGGKGMLQQKKSWYWDQYTAQHKEILHRAEDQFQELFGDAFSIAYEKQIRELKTLRSSNSE